MGYVSSLLQDGRRFAVLTYDDAYSSKYEVRRRVQREKAAKISQDLAAPLECYLNLRRRTTI